MKYLIQIWYKNEELNSRSLIYKNEIKELLKKEIKLKTVQNYLIELNSDRTIADFIAQNLLQDKVIEDYRILDGENANRFEINIEDDFGWVVSVDLKKGVTNPNDEIILKHFKKILGEDKIKNVKTSSTFYLDKKLNEEEVKIIVKRILANELIHEVYIKNIK